MNAVIYARYSSDNQREESIEGQLRECKEYADQNGITVVRTYIDRALSAKTDSRPQFQQMIHDSATHTFEAVLVWKLDRFSRNRYDSAHYKRILKNNRVHVVSVTEPISNTPEGIMLESLLEGMAEYYSAELAEKVSRGHKENALKAKFNGGPVPLGYRIDSEHHYQIDPNTAPVVQEAFHRYAAGESIRSIIESLNARGIRNSRGNPFTKNSFQTLLKNRRYLGEYRYKDTVIPDAIPAIIDLDCFDAVQRRCEIHRQAPAHNKADVHYLLTTKLFCGKCGAMMAGESGRSHTGTVHCYYKCGTRKRSGKEACSLKPVRKEPLEQFVVKTALEKVRGENFEVLCETIKKTAFKVTRVGQLVAQEASRMLNVPFGIVDLSLAPTPAIGDSVADILCEIGLEHAGAPGTTAALALLNDQVKKGGVMASSYVGGLSGAFIPVSEDQGMIDAVNAGALTIEKLEAMTCVCSVGLDMIAIPGDTKATTISGIIADEMAIGMVNQKTTAVRIIPVIGKGVGETVEFGGLLGYAPIMPVNTFSCDAFVNRGGRIPAPIHSFKN